jgi:hypothetical protein
MTSRAHVSRRRQTLPPPPPSLLVSFIFRAPAPLLCSGERRHRTLPVSGSPDRPRLPSPADHPIALHWPHAPAGNTAARPAPAPQQPTWIPSPADQPSVAPWLPAPADQPNRAACTYPDPLLHENPLPVPHLNRVAGLSLHRMQAG